MSQSLQGDTGNDQHPKPSPVAWLREAIVARSSSTTSSSAGGAQVARNSSLGGGSASAGSDSNDTDSLCRSASWASTTPTSPGASTAALRAMAAQEEPLPPIPTVQSHFGKEWDTDYSIGSPQAGVASLLPLKLGDVPIAPARETSLPNTRSSRRRSSSENVELGLTPPGRSRSASVTDQDGSGSGSGSGTGTSPNSFNTAGEASPIVPFTASAAEASSASLVATSSGEQDPARSQSSLASSNATYAARMPLNLHKPLPPPGKASPVLEADNEPHSHSHSQNIPLLSLSPAHGPTWSFDPYAELRSGDMPATSSNVSSPGLSAPLSASEQGHPWGDSPPGSASSQLRSAITKSGRRIRKSFLWSGGSNGDGSSEAPKSSSLSPADRSAGSSRWTSPSSSRAPSPSISPQSSEMNMARSASPRPTAYSLDSPLHAGPSRSNSYLERQLRRDRLTTSTDSDATLLARQHLGTAAKSEAEVFHTPESVVEGSEYPWNSSTLRQSSPSSSRRLSNLFLQQLGRDLPPLPTSPSSTRAHSNVEPMVPVRPSLAGGSKLHAARSVQDLQLSYAGHRAQEEVEPVALVAAQHARQKRSWAGSLREKSTRRTSSSAALGSASSTDLADDGAGGASGGEKKGSAWSRMKVRPRSSHDALKTLSTHHGIASTSSYFTHTNEAYTQPYEGEYHAPNTTFSRVARSFRSRMTPLDAGGTTPRSEAVPAAGQTPRARQVSGGSAVSLMDLSPMTPRTEAPDSPISPGLRDLAAAQLSIDLAELPSDDDALFVDARERHSRSGSEATGTTDTSGTLHTCADYSDGGEGVLDVDKAPERAPQPSQEAQPKRTNRRHSFGRALSSVWTARHGAHPNASAAVEAAYSPARSDFEPRASAQSDRTELPSRPGTSMGFSSHRTSGTGDEDDEHVPAPHRSRIPRIPSGLTMTAAARAAPPTSFRHPPSADEASGVGQNGVKLASRGTASASEATPQQPQRKKRRHVRSSSASSYIVATMRGAEVGMQDQVHVIAPPRSSSQAARRISFGSGAPASTIARKSKNKAREPSSAESDADKPALWINTHAVPNASDASSAGEGEAGRSAGSASAGPGGQPALSIVDDSEFLRALEQVRALHLSALARAHATSDRLERMAKMGMAPALRRERAAKTGESNGSRGSAKRSSSADARLERLRDEGEEEDRDALLPLLDMHDTFQATAGSGLQREGSIARRPHDMAASGVGSAVASSDEDWKMEVKSLFVIRELVQTELSYQRHLESLLSAVRSMPTTTPTSDFSSRLRRKSYNGLSSSFSNTLSPSKAGNAALSSINASGTAANSGASSSSISSSSSAGLVSQAAHLRTLRKLLPPLIALSRNLSTRITRDPTAGGVGAAFRAVAPQLEAVFVAWNAQAAEMMDGLRHSEGSKGRARDRIGLVPLLVEIGSSAAAPGAAKKEARSNTSSFAPSSSAKRGRAMDALALTRPSSPTHGVAPQRRERKGSDVPPVQVAGGSVSPASSGWSPRTSLPASRQRRRSTVSALDFDAVPAFGAHAKESSSHSSSATLEAPRTRPASSAAVASLGKRAMSAVSRKSGAASEGPSPASPTAASAVLPRSSSAVPFADSPISSPLDVRGAHPAPTTAQRKKQLGALDIAIMPTQRVPRYLLLLRDLLSNTPARSVAHARVGQAIESLLLVARACDDSAQMRLQAGEERTGTKGRQNGPAQPAGGSTASASTRTLTTARSAGALSSGRKTSPAAATTTTAMPRLKAQPVQGNSHATFGSTTTAAQRAASLSPAPKRNGSAMGR